MRGPQGNFGGDGKCYYLDCGDGYTRALQSKVIKLLKHVVCYTLIMPQYTKKMLSNGVQLLGRPFRHCYRSTKQLHVMVKFVE